MIAGGSLFAQWDNYPGVPLVMRLDSDIWRLGTVVHTDNNVTRRLPQGTRVLGESAGFRGEINRIFDDIAFIEYEGNLYSTRTSNLSPISEIHLPGNWITEPDAPKRWVISFYLTVLRSQDRDTFFNYEQPWMDWSTDLIMRGDPLGGTWRNAPINFESLVFFDAVITMGGFARGTFFITDIAPFNTGYSITVANFRGRGSGDLIPSSLPVPLWSERQSLDLIFIPDGDFMDVYLDSLDNHFATFAKVEAVFLEELQNLVWTNTVDLSRITSWPRRADGSMDIPPPDALNGFLATHTTSARLNVRSGPSTDAALVTTLEVGTAVQVLETGPQASIGGTIAPWVRVATRDGYTGWCFSGFLVTAAAAVPAAPPLAPGVVPRPLAGPGALPPAAPVAAPVPPPPETESAGRSLPPWMFVAAGGVLFGALILALAAKKRKAA